MRAPDLPAVEAARLAALHALEILDTPSEPGFDDLAMVASRLCGAPIALVSLVDDCRQWFKARVGLDAPATAKEISFCGHVVASGASLVVPDSHEDDRFFDNPLVTGPPHVRFYAGAPLITPEGHVLGSLCVIDHAPRALSNRQLGALEALARQVSAQIELRRRVRDRDREVQELLQLKDDFVSVVSHELRTPLTSIRGGVELVTSGVLGELPQEVAEVLTLAKSNIHRLGELVDDLLDLQTLNAGELSMTLESVDLQELLDEEVEGLTPTVRRAGLQLRCTTRAEGAQIVCDPARIGQVVRNLVSNATKFAPPGSVVELRSSRQGPMARVEVIDRGPGVPAAFRPRLFERFAQAAPVTTRSHRGTGLGLAISRAIVEGHGGRIGYADADGGGSAFWFTLPERGSEPGSLSMRM